MRKITPLMLFLLFACILPSPVSADDQIRKNYCLSAVGYDGDIAALKSELLVNAKQNIAEESFKEDIETLVKTDDPLLTKESTKAAAAGYVIIVGEPSYLNGKNLGEVCVNIVATVDHDMAKKFVPISLTKKTCVKAADSSIVPETLRHGIIKEILFDFDPELKALKQNTLMPLFHQPIYTDESFNQPESSYCTNVSGKVYPFEIDRAKSNIDNGSNQDKDLGPLTIIMKTANSSKPALFPHRNHQERMECAVCHHAEAADGSQAPYIKGMKVERCANCHNSDMENKMLNNLKLAGHARCKTCHKSKDISTKCNFCHPQRINSPS